MSAKRKSAYFCKLNWLMWIFGKWIISENEYFYWVINILFFPAFIDLPCLTIHGDKYQHERTAIINAFKTVRDILIGTDVASRGLDIRDIMTVINFHPPKDADTYVHRIGRTGRAGN